MSTTPVEQMADLLRARGYERVSYWGAYLREYRLENGFYMGVTVYLNMWNKMMNESHINIDILHDPSDRWNSHVNYGVHSTIKECGTVEEFARSLDSLLEEDARKTGRYLEYLIASNTEEEHVRA